MRWRSALGLVLLGLFSVATTGLLSQDAELLPPRPIKSRLTYDGPDFGPGDGEPAVNFRLIVEHFDGGMLSVQLEGRHLYIAALPRADFVESAEGGDREEGVEIKITRKQIEQVLGRKFDDPDLPPVTVQCVIFCGRTMNLLDVVTWNGYLQGCWLEFPELAQSTDGAGDEPTEPLRKRRVDISSTLGQAMPIDVRLEKNTIFYLLFASENREAVLLHPENPEIYSAATIVAGGRFRWKRDDEPPENEVEGELDVGLYGPENVLPEYVSENGSKDGASENGLDDDPRSKNKHLKRLKYTPGSKKMYLVLWTLHRTEKPALVADGEPTVDVEASDPDSEKNPRVNGWTRSAVYEFTNGLPEPEEDEIDSPDEE